MTEPAADHDKTGEPGATIAALLSLPQFRAFIASLDKAALAEMETSLEWFGIPAGATLFRQGDAASDFFFVMTGRLGVLVDAGHGEQLFAQILPGEARRRNGDDL